MGNIGALFDTVTSLERDRRQRFYGKFRAIVTDNTDPEQQGRIRAKLPELFLDEEMGWAMPCVPFAPPSHGMLALPEIGSNVWIEFEAGDPSRPVWTGGWWPTGKAPSLSSPSVKIFETAAGNRITWDDTSGSEAITIQDKNGATITLNQQGIELKKGGMSIKLTDSQISINDGALTVM
jgi:uncharacterized protein involved in type VI secretion and phage assembly